MDWTIKGRLKRKKKRKPKVKRKVEKSKKRMDISNTLYIVIVIVMLLIFWYTDSLILAQSLGTIMILSQFGFIYYYGRRLAKYENQL